MSIIKNYQSAKGTCKVTFSYPLNEGVKSVKILGDFNNWDSSNATNMKKSKTDFNAVVELKAGAVYEFRYLLDDANWDNDHNADRYVSSPFSGVNNSVIVLDEVVSAPKAQAKKSSYGKTSRSKSKIVKEAVKNNSSCKNS
ncbi:MAG: isoamylase early set domain-containing protein [Saprospiraceae bacterium]|nr:isoamylase early set domain-containing protein [Saprospiraceae bacterium]